jgi:hypothetical protein
MTDMKSGVVLKRDERGRVRTPRERREALLDEFEKSGVSGMQFARLVGIKYPTFAAWAQRRRQKRPSDPKSSVPSVPKTRWLEAVLDQGKHPAGFGQSALVIHLPGGARMEVADAMQAALAAALLRSLENKSALAC